jgi:hypothetical protein
MVIPHRVVFVASEGWEVGELVLEEEFVCHFGDLGSAFRLFQRVFRLGWIVPFETVNLKEMENV